MSDLKVFNASEALTAINEKGDKIWTITEKKIEKTYSGSRFLDITFNIGNLLGVQGWFSAENILLTGGVPDPANKEIARNAHESNRLQCITTVANSGDLGQFLLKLNDVFKTYYDKNRAEDGKFHEMVQKTISKKNKNGGGKSIEDPVVRFSIKFDKYPEKHPITFLRGKQKTLIYDARTERTIIQNGKSVKTWDLATVENDDGEKETINASNVHKFITFGSKIVYLRFHIGSVCISQSWVSIPLIAQKLVIMPQCNTGFSDENGIDICDSGDTNQQILNGVETTNNDDDDVVANALAAAVNH